MSLPEQAEQALFRIAQEALTNAVRHGDATDITLVLRAPSGQIEFVIGDNGKGFEPTKGQAAHGLGLSLMQERVQELGGSLSIDSTRGAGTRVAVRLPHEGSS